MSFKFKLLMLSFLLSGCVSLDPQYQRPESPVPTAWAAAGAQSQTQAASLLSGWQNTLGDPGLKAVVQQALTSNRDLRKAIADIEAARAQYGEEKSALFPALTADLSTTRSRSLTQGQSTLSSSAEAEGAVSSFELDLFGKNHSLSRAARESWLASQATALNTRLTLIAETTEAWVTLATDKSNLQLAQETARSAKASLELTQRRQAAGIDTGTDVSDAMTVYQQARADVASYITSVQQDRNALDLLAGGSVDPHLLPNGLDDLPPDTIALVPAGVRSDLLLRRPDVLEAEHNLKSANADIGAARADFFPSISLTASAGVGSSSLSSLFSHGAGVWSFAPAISLPLFSGGANVAALHYAEAEKKGLVASYEKAVQSAFKDVANALARRETLAEQLDAQQEYVKAAEKSLRIADSQYRAGTGDYLSVLTARRTVYAARLALISLRQTDLNNRITLWQSLGGGLDTSALL
ncbi:efflux transporter outer membrane subunit [Pantoea alhagi]|uniref:efflux transporter outer membrane subunit n=1 Tax=Pantoea alhagi TaxID=1891675 RepID=UPI00202B7E78|nr:efflux transporter outer membrane subunit [Pantoea alhagi]URQ59478.1 efflux transporter outer membrane subunit [Pantoea alhagi]